MFSADSATGNQVINLNFVQIGQPTFYYPVFWFTDASNELEDATLITNFIGGNTTQATSSDKTRTIGNLSDVDLDNASGDPMYIWVAYPTGSPDIVRADLRVRRGDQDSIVMGTLSTAQRSTTDLTFISSEAGVPASASEDYKWFWVTVPANTRITLGDTS